MVKKMAESSEIRLDPWLSLYADRTSGLSASEVRSLFAVASRPEVVSLAGGMPYVTALGDHVIQDAVGRVMANAGAKALQYGSGQGEPSLREHITEVMALDGIAANADDVVITTGSQEGLDLITRLFIDPGDVILAEGPSYVGALGVFRSYQAETVHVPFDDDGLNPQALQDTIDRVTAEGKTIKLLYTIPDFHNPAGVTLAASRRPEILEITQRNNILLVEDNPYGLLYFDAPPPPAIRSLDDAGVLYLGSFSKTLAPGFRVGWVLAPHAIREKLILAQESAVLSPSTFNQLIISDYLENSDWRGQIATFRDLYRDRRDAMLHALDEHLPNLSWTFPNGGFYVWLRLPDGMDSKAMLPLAVRELVAYTPGTAFYADGGGESEIRLSFCYPTPEEIRVGIGRLARVVSSESSLLETFKPVQETHKLVPRKLSHISSPPPNMN